MSLITCEVIQEWSHYFLLLSATLFSSLSSAWTGLRDWLFCGRDEAALRHTQNSESSYKLVLKQ